MIINGVYDLNQTKRNISKNNLHEVFMPETLNGAQ